MPRFLPLIFAFVGLGLLAGGGIAAKDTRDLLAVAEEVPGVVVDFTTSTSEGDTSYSPVYEYEHEGRTYRHETTVSSSSRPEMGRTETILIDPDDPSEAKPNTFMDKWFIAVLLGGMGALFFVIGIVLFLVGLTRAGSSRGAVPLEQRVDQPPTSHSHEDHDPFVGQSDPKQSGPFL